MGTWSKVRSFLNNAGYVSGTAGSPYGTTAPANLVVGDLLVISFEYGSGSDQSAILSASDASANSWTNEAHAYDATNHEGAMRFSTVITTQIASGGAIQVSWTGGASFNFLCLFVEQWHYSTGTPIGIDGTPTGQAQATPGTGTDAITSGTTSPSHDGCLVHSALVYGNSIPTTTTVGTGFTSSVNDLATSQMATEQLTQGSHAAIAGTWTEGSAQPTLCLVTAYAPPAGGPVSKTDTDTATLTELVPRITLGVQTDALTLTETQSVTVGGVTSKTDTDTATLSEAAPGPQVGVSDSAALSETSITLIATDVQTVPDFTLAEQTPQIGLTPTDSLTFVDQETLTASFIRWTDTDAFGLAEATPRIDLSLTDALSLTERVPALSHNQTDAVGLTEAQTVAAFLKDIDTDNLAESQTVTILGGFTGYAKGLLTVQDRLGGVLTSSARLAGTLGATDRLEGTLTVQPVGPP